MKISGTQKRAETQNEPGKSEPIRSMLAARYRYSAGRTKEIAALLLAHEKKDQLKTARCIIECLYDDDPGIVLRASGVLERVTRSQPAVFNRWKAPLLALLLEASENKLRWNLALIVPRLSLTQPESRRVADILQSFLEDPSSVVKTFALQGMADLSLRDPSRLPAVLDLLEIYSRTGTPAMRARSRILIRKLGGKPA
jgi:hypothetical protein